MLHIPCTGTWYNKLFIPRSLYPLAFSQRLQRHVEMEIDLVLFLLFRRRKQTLDSVHYDRVQPLKASVPSRYDSYVMLTNKQVAVQHGEKKCLYTLYCVPCQDRRFTGMLFIESQVQVISLFALKGTTVHLGLFCIEKELNV